MIMGLGACIFEKPPNVQLSQMVPEKQNTLGIALSQRSSRELSKSFEIFKKSSLSSEIQVLKVGDFSEIPRFGAILIPCRAGVLLKSDKSEKNNCAQIISELNRS